MSEQSAKRDEQSNAHPDTLAPLPGEPGIPNVASARPVAVSKKGLFALLVLVSSLVAASVFSIQRLASANKASDADKTLLRDKPVAAGTEPRRPEMAAGSLGAVASAPSAPAPRIPAITPMPNEAVEPIGVRPSATTAPVSVSPKGAAPEDAPVLLVSMRPGALPAQAGRTNSRPGSDGGSAGSDDPSEGGETTDPLAATARNLRGYQRQLQGLLENLTKNASVTGQPPTGALLGGPPVASPPGASVQSAAGGLFGGQLAGSSTPKVVASTLGNRSLTLPKGTAFTCALKTRVISAASGLVGCQVQRNVFSDDGRVLLVERGSHLDGEYRVASVRPGTVRIPVVWTRIRTPLGVTVDIESPGTGQLGESGVDGHVDNRWVERIGAALLLSVIDDAVKLMVQSNRTESAGETVVLPQTTSQTSKLAEKVLDSTVNIPPLIYRNQGGIVGIYVARDVDFSSVYELKPTALDLPREAQR